MESGNAEAGIVYKTDAAVSRKVRVAWEVPQGEGPRIVYPVAQLKAEANPTVAAAKLTFLDRAAARQSFVKSGFVVLPEPAEGAETR